MKYIHIKNWRSRTKERLLNGFDNKCGICGYNKCKAALEFHHLDPTEKDFSISAWRKIAKWETIVKEIKKCVLLCANCHREVHYSNLEISKEILRFKKENETYQRVSKKVSKCMVCDNDKPARQKFCSVKCVLFYKEKKWNKINLQALITKNVPFVKIAKLVGVSDVAVRKRAKKLGYVE